MIILTNQIIIACKYSRQFNLISSSYKEWFYAFLPVISPANKEAKPKPMVI